MLIRTLLFTFVFLIGGPLWANDSLDSDLMSGPMDLFNQDPSLLLDPSNQISQPPGLPPTEMVREVQSLATADSKFLADSVSQDPSLLLMPDNQVPAPPAEEVKREVQSVEPQPVVESQPMVESQAIEEASRVAVPESIPKTESSNRADLKAEKSTLEVVPGTNDISIILTDSEFFPSIIKMRPTEKSRLLFISTSQKPAALIFTKPQIQRWLATSSNTKIQTEKKEITSSRVTPIEFSAEPGTYKFYDALSGAAGEIQVE